MKYRMIAATLTTLATVPAQDWSQFAGATPPGVYSTRMAYDSDRATMVMFGGIPADTGWPHPTPVAATWEFANGAWTLQTPAQSPPARTQHSMCFDGNHVIVFGGISSNGSPLNDVWWYDGVNWQTAYYPFAPAARAGAAVIGDQGLLVVGGWSPILGMLGDAWSWSSSSGWSLQSLTVPPRRDAAIARAWIEDPFSGNMVERRVLHGGTDGVTTSLSDTWVFHGTWQQLPAAGGPSRSEHTLVYDEVSKVTFLVGGRGANGSPLGLGDLWRFDGEAWIDMPTTTSPVGTTGAAVAMDSLRRRIVMVGGATDALASQVSDEHWEFEPPVIGETFGSSCSPWPITAQLFTRLCARGKPWEGSVFVSNANNLPWAVFVFGLSNASWNGTPLPHSLAALGIPNCNLLVDPAVLQLQTMQPAFLPLGSGIADFSLQIPNVPAAYGQDLYVQAIAGSSSNVLLVSPGRRAVVW